jgi:predicted nucleic acid-binding protein
MNQSPAPDFLADTSAFIRLIRRDPQVEKTVKGKILAITFVTFAELNLGILKASDPSAAFERCLEVMGGLQVFHGSGKTPIFYARIFHDLTQRGQKIPTNDIWIAAIALEASLPILCRDQHFSRISGLTVIQC